jgi:hypothetical protein
MTGERMVFCPETLDAIAWLMRGKGGKKRGLDFRTSTKGAPAFVRRQERQHPMDLRRHLRGDGIRLERETDDFDLDVCFFVIWMTRQDYQRRGAFRDDR